VLRGPADGRALTDGMTNDTIPLTGICGIDQCSSHGHCQSVNGYCYCLVGYVGDSCEMAYSEMNGYIIWQCIMAAIGVCYLLGLLWRLTAIARSIYLAHYACHPRSPDYHVANLNHNNNHINNGTIPIAKSSPGMQRPNHQQHVDHSHSLLMSPSTGGQRTLSPGAVVHDNLTVPIGAARPPGDTTFPPPTIVDHSPVSSPSLLLTASLPLQFSAGTSSEKLFVTRPVPSQQTSHPSPQPHVMIKQQPQQGSLPNAPIRIGDTGHTNSNDRSLFVSIITDWRVNMILCAMITTCSCITSIWSPTQMAWHSIERSFINPPFLYGGFIWIRIFLRIHSRFDSRTRKFLSLIDAILIGSSILVFVSHVRIPSPFPSPPSLLLICSLRHRCV
jgi:hypothetical protein